MAAIDGMELGIELDELERAAPKRLHRRAPPALAESISAAGAPLLAESPEDLSSSVFPASIPYPPHAPGRALCWQGIRSNGPIIAADVLALALSGIVAAVVVHLVWPHAMGLWRPMGVVVALLPVAYGLCGLYSPVGLSPILELRHLIQVNSIGFIAAALGGVLAPPLPLWCLATWVAAVALVPLLRSLVRRYCAQTGWWGRPTLVISPAQSADAVVLAMIHAPTSGFRPVAVTDPAGPCWSALTPAVNGAAELEKIVREQSIRYAVVNVPDRNPAAVREIFACYSALIPHLIVLNDTSDLPCLWGATRSCGRLGGIEMSNARLLSSLWTLKRAIDIIVALMVLVLFFPLMAAIALAIKLTSSGPIFFGHRRLGFQGKWFNAWKFRTMHPDGDAVLHDYLAAHTAARDEWERDQKLRRDPRVTRIGKFLRQSSLDELPQVWNVLKGEMSLVGPRPIVAKEVAKYGHVFGKYAAVKPGITGMWQVSGRNEVSYEERVKLDQYYVANWSPWLDLFILAKTIIVLIRRDGAY